MVAVATIITNGGAYLFNVACIRYLGSAVYGDVAAILALTALVTLPLGAVQLALAREVAQIPSGDQVGPLLRRWTLRAFVGARGSWSWGSR